MKLLIFLHRWLGIVFGSFFAMWFFTGMVMMYVPFPSLPDADRLSYLTPINAADIAVHPAEVIKRCDPDRVSGLRLISIRERPAYVCRVAGSSVKAVYADTGVDVPPLEGDAAVKLSRRVTIDTVQSVSKVEHDQWTVHQRFDVLRPFYRIELQDVAGTHWYVSALTGEFVQRTTGSQRFWNYIGAVVHWIYPTVLRKHWALWDSVVWWLSGLGIVCAVIGIYLGISHLVKLRRSGQSLVSPFRGWMKWHHIVGLCTGLIIVSWIVSGWLSMDHGRLFSIPVATAEQKLAVQGLALSEASASVSVQTLTQYKGVRELSFHAFGSKARIVAKTEEGVVETAGLEPEYVADVISTALPGMDVVDYGIVPHGDTYTHLREGQLPPGTIRVELSDSSDSWLHIDPHSGEIVSILDRSRRAYRWLYNGLHSLDIPGLVNRRPLWDAVMLVLLLAGFIASVTGLVIGLRRLRRTVSS